MPNKREITQKVIEHLGDRCSFSLDQALHSWWKNLRESGGLQLSVIGYRIFQDHAGFERFEFAIPAPNLNARTLLILDQHLRWPWIVVNGSSRAIGAEAKLVLFGSQEAVMATLYGDLTTWLRSLDQSNCNDK
jgi:hypothetical protein